MKATLRSAAKAGLARSAERRALLHNLEETKEALDLAHSGFNQTGDPDLMEFYLFEINALRARHTYLLRRIKALEEESSSVPLETSSPLQNP
ncbi:MAG: hypothetical protein H6Q61_42 [Firmicutes bacterium]|nr:hypothetical protein [Bacillota bacterium]